MKRHLFLIIFVFIIVLPCFANEKQKDASMFASSANQKMKSNDYQGAIEDYTKYTYLYPDVVSTYVNRGLAYNFQGNYDAAIVDWTKCIDLAKNKFDGALVSQCSFYRGKAYYQKKAYKKAISDLNIAKKEALSSQKEEIDKYIQLANKKIENASDADVYLEQAKTAFDNGKFEQACLYLDSAINLEPQNAYYYELKAAIKANMNEFFSAVDNAKKAKDLYYAQGNIKKYEKMEAMIKSIQSN